MSLAAAPPRWTRSFSGSRSSLPTVTTAVVVAGVVLLGPVLVRWPWAAFGLAAAGALVVAVFFDPPVAGYVVVGIVPLIAGMNRGGAFAVLRPGEALVLIAGLVLVVRRLLVGRSEGPRLRLRTTEAAMVFLVIAGSVMPMLWLLARGRPVTQDDLLYSAQIAKFVGVYVVVRASIRTEEQVRRCLALSVAAGVVVAVIGILQALKIFGVPGLLEAHFQPTDEGLLTINRATSTLGHSFAMADLMVIDLAIVGAWLLRGARRPALLALAGLVFIVGALASGQFSGAIGLAVGLAALGWITGYARRVALAVIPVVVGAAFILQPVIQTRLQGFASPQGLPDSWLGRLENLQLYIWPRLFSGFQWVLGVQPSAKVHHAGPLSPFSYIESGYTWLLWVGGVPLLLAFLAFLWTNVRATKRIARGRADAVGIAASTAFVGLVVLAVLTFLDPHMTLRGSGDVLFAVIALAYTASRPGTAASVRAAPQERVTSVP